MRLDVWQWEGYVDKQIRMSCGWQLKIYVHGSYKVNGMKRLGIWKLLG